MAQGDGRDTSAVNGFGVFAVLYSIAIGMELGEQWIDPWFTGTYLLAAGAAIATGMTRLKFLLLLVASTAYFLVFRFPDVANHVTLMLCLNIAMVLAIGNSLIKRRDAPEHDYATVLPVLRLGLILVYAIAGFDKLNSDFFDPVASCATGILTSIIDAMQTRIWGVPVVAGVSIALGILGFRLIRRGRFGAAGNRVFTVTVSLFVAVGGAAALWLLFAHSTTNVGHLAAVGLIVALAVIGWELGGGLLLAVPRLQAGILGFSLTMHAALALIGFVDFGALAVALLFSYVPAEQLPALTRGSRSPRMLAYAGICLCIAVVSGLSARVHTLDQLTLLTGLAFDAALIVAIWPLLVRVFSVDRGPRWAGVRVLDTRMPRALYLVPLAIVFVGLTPYLGLRTAGNFSMFSNLRTEGERSNHFLLGGNPLKVWGYQEDVVWILDIDDRFGADIYHYDGSPRGYALPVVEFRKWIHAWDQAGYRVPMTYAYDGYRYSTADIVTDPTWRTPDLSPQMYLMDFRYIQPGEPNSCRW